MFSEAEEGVTDFDERHNPRFAEDVAKNADGIGKLNLFNFKVDKKTGEQTSVQYENDILHCLDGVVMLQVRNNKHKKVIPIDQLEALDVPHYQYTFVMWICVRGIRRFWCSRRVLPSRILIRWLRL